MDAMALTVREVADLLGVDDSTVRAWARTGRLKRNEHKWQRGRGRLTFSVWDLVAPSVPPTPMLDSSRLGKLVEQAAAA